MELKEQFDELIEVKLMVEGKVFQKYFAQPMREYQSKLKSAYDCDSLKELHTVKGKKQGSQQFFELLKDIDRQYKNTQYELNRNL